MAEMKQGAIDILKKLENNKCKSLSEIKRLARLKKIGILKTNGGLDDCADDIVSLLRYSYQLSDDFINSIYSQTEELLDIISKGFYEKLADRAICREDGKLVKQKIIESESSMRHSIFSKGNSVKLNENLKLKLIGDKKKRKRGEIVMKDDDLFEVIKPSIPIEKVILHPKTNEELTIAIEKIQKNTANILKEWGITNSLQ